MPIAPDPLPVKDDMGVSALVQQAMADIRALARAEVALIKARSGERVTAYKVAGLYFAIAGALALAALIALMVGLILTLATLIGPGGATAMVVGVALLIVATLAAIGKSKLGSKP